MDPMIREFRPQVHQDCEGKWLHIMVQAVYICVIGTLCEPLFAIFPCDSWIRLFENPKVAAEHKRDKPAKTPLGMRSDDSIGIYLHV